MSMAATEIKFIHSLLSEIQSDNTIQPSILREDNTGAIFMANNTAIGQRTKHVDIRYRFVNDMILSKQLSVEHIRTAKNPSDLMTKNLPSGPYIKHAETISEGLLGSYYDPPTTEDVKIYSATGTVNSDNTSASSPRYIGSNTICPAISHSPTDLTMNTDNWVTVISIRRSKTTSQG